jgi:hypothetical protein
VSKVASRSELELCGISISTSRVELGKAVGSIWPRAHKGAEGQGFRGNAGKDIKGMGRDNIGKVRDHSNAVSGIRSIVERRINGQGSVRKSRGRVRM